MTTIPDEYSRRLAEDIGRLLDFTLNEPVLLRRLEKHYSPKPAKLASSDVEVAALKERLDRLTDLLAGAVEAAHTPSVPASPPVLDTYAASAISEVLEAFHRSRSSVCRAHVFFIARGVLIEHPDFLRSPERSEEYRPAAEAAFWDHVETALIRLASFWDRVGQLLDFVFFGVRQFDREGFASVLDRIRSNFMPLYPDIGLCPSWTRLRHYQQSEREDGLKWLVRRRNLVIHSLHLRPGPIMEPSHPALVSTYNHLEVSLEEKLKPESPKHELGRLHNHLFAAATLFADVLTLCEIGWHAIHRPARA